MRPTTLLTALFLTVGSLAAYAQTATPPDAKTLTPAEQKRKDKLERDIQEQRKFKAEMAERQRQYFAEQAEKERKKKEKEAEREAKKRGESSPAVTTETPKTSTAQPAQPERRNTSTTPPETTPAPTVAPPATNPSDPASERAIRRAADAARKEQADRDRAARQAQTEKEKAARQALTNQEREAARQQAQQQKEADRRQEELNRQQAQQERVSKNTPPAEPNPQLDAASALPVAIRPDTVEAFGPRKQFLPKDHLFAPILLDPLQAQTYGSLLPVFISNGDRYKGSIVPFAFGLQKPFVRRQTGTNRASEWALDLASFTQFEVYQDEKLNKQRRQLINTDYRVGISYHIRRGPATWRFRAYHLSSHLGDDYIIRNQLTYRLPNSVNYELVDATYSRQVRDFRVYGGLGVGLRISEERKPLSAQAGFWYRKPTAKTAQLVGGIDLKLWQQTDFRPGIKAGVGVTAGRGPGNLTFLLETYSGFRPYSIYETDNVFWLGFGVYLQPF